MADEPPPIELPARSDGHCSAQVSGPLLRDYAPYIFVRPLGRGGFGEASLAFHPDRPDHHVVLKVPHGNSSAARLLRSEAEKLRALNHPLIVRFLELVNNPVRDFVVMEFASGGSLADRLASGFAGAGGGLLTPSDAARFLLDILSALEYVHLKGILHLDITPANILLNAAGDYLLADFGLSRLSSDGSSFCAGTRPYIAPEVLARMARVTSKADVWSAGVVLFKALTGSSRGVTADDAAAWAGVGAWKPPPLPASTTAALDELLRLMLTVNVESRPDSGALLQHPAVLQLKQIVAESGRMRVASPIALAAAPAPIAADCYSPLVLLGLPLRPNMVGREADLARLLALCTAESDAAIVGLRGMGGIGKTVLALTLAHELAPRFHDGQLFLDARGTQHDPPSPEVLLARVIRAFRPRVQLPDGLDALCAAYRAELRGRRVLLVLDDARDAAQATPLLPPPGCALIVTSRNGFMLGTCALQCLDRLSDTDALALIRAYVPALTDADATAVVRSCTGLPLALRLAGSALALDMTQGCDALSVEDYIRRLQSARIAGLDEAAECAREASISERIKVSEELLPEEDRATWRKLGVFSSSFSADAAASVAGANGAQLHRLALRSLLEREQYNRFRLHDLVADYARAQIGEPALYELRLEHSKHFLEVSRRADALYQRDVVAGLALFDFERAHIEAAMAWLCSCSIDDGRTTLQLALLGDSLEYTGRLRLRPRVRIAMLERQLQAARALGDPTILARALCSIGSACNDAGTPGCAIPHCSEALSICRRVQDPVLEARALGSLGNAHSDLGAHREAIGCYEKALAIARDARDSRAEAINLGNIGFAHNELGDPRAAIACHEMALGVSRRCRDRRVEGNTLSNLGRAYRASGDLQKTIDLLMEALAISHEVDDRRVEGNTLFHLALALRDAGRHDESVLRMLAALEVFTSLERSKSIADAQDVLSGWQVSYPKQLVAKVTKS